MMFTSHIKAPVLKGILLENKSCEEKLNKLKDLVGIPSEQTAETPNAGAADERALSKEKILANLSVSEKKLQINCWTIYKRPILFLGIHKHWN